MVKRVKKGPKDPKGPKLSMNLRPNFFMVEKIIGTEKLRLYLFPHSIFQCCFGPLEKGGKSEETHNLHSLLPNEFQVFQCKYLMCVAGYL